MDLRNEFHIDHIFPQSRFTRSRLLSAGVPEADVEEFMVCFNRLPNLQLMEGPVNVAKQDKYPAAWMMEHYSDEGARDAYRARHELGDVPEEITGFMEFYAARQERIGARLRTVLGVPVS
jgi:hypothetical protein